MADPYRGDTMNKVMVMDTHNFNPSVFPDTSLFPQSNEMRSNDAFGGLFSDGWEDLLNGPNYSIARYAQANALGTNAETSNQIAPNFLAKHRLDLPHIPTTKNLDLEYSLSTPQSGEIIQGIDGDIEFLVDSYPSSRASYNDSTTGQSPLDPSTIVNVERNNIPIARNLGKQIVEDHNIPTVGHLFSSVPEVLPYSYSSTIAQFTQQRVEAVGPNFHNPVNCGDLFYDSNVGNSQAAPSNVHGETIKQLTEPNLGTQRQRNKNSGHVPDLPSGPILCNCGGSKIVKEIIHHKVGLVRMLQLHGDVKLGIFIYAMDTVHDETDQYAVISLEEFNFNSNEEVANFLTEYCILQELEGYQYGMIENSFSLFYKILSMGPGDHTAMLTSSTHPESIQMDEDAIRNIHISSLCREAAAAAAAANHGVAIHSYHEAEEDTTAATTSSHAVKRIKRKIKLVKEFDLAEQRKLIKTMPLSHLKQWYHLRRGQAAAKLGICETAVTKIFNRFYPNGRWPYRKVNGLIKRIRKLGKDLENPEGRDVDEIRNEIEKKKQKLDSIYGTDSLEFLPSLFN